MDDLRFWIWLSFLDLNPSEKICLLNKYGDPEKIFKIKKEDLKTIPDRIVTELLDKNKRNSIKEKINIIIEKNIKVIRYIDKEYPENLKNIYGFPIVLYARGNINLLKSNNMVSIVGCRECSNYGREIAYKLGDYLSRKDIVVISGLAKGIDVSSHIGALKNDCKTIAVLGSGIDYIYPYQNKNIYEQIIKGGGLVISEYLPGVNPEKTYFPMRNRIISGLSDIVIIVEAKAQSGSLITADLALEQGKEIFVVPGNINSPTSKGTNNLIKDGAQILTSVEDIINTLNKY